MSAVKKPLPSLFRFAAAKHLAAVGLIGLGLMAMQRSAWSQSATTSNSSNLTNSAAPSASSVTTGGTNINYQSNNTFQNEMGFAPGIFCRTPSLYMGGNWGEGFLTAFDPLQASGNNNTNYSFNAGIVVPFGSSVIQHCKMLAEAIARDREISSQLSMLRTCAQLEKEGLSVDPELYPLLKPCIKKSTAAKTSPSNLSQPSATSSPASPVLKPKTTRVL
jgi:hypothetical protein